MDFFIQQGMIDSHFHGLIMESRNPGTVNLIKNIVAEGLDYAVDIGTHNGDLEERQLMYHNMDNILLTTGNYPSEADNAPLEAILNNLEMNIIRSLDDENLKTISAVGEIGLDWYHDYATKEKQKDLFMSQVNIANRHQLPVVIHNREADTETAAILKAISPSAGGIMHCFSSGYKAASEFLDLGLMISFAGNITYKKNHEIQEAAKKIPLESILIETDSPFLSPQKVRQKENSPGHIGYTYEFIADLRGIPVTELIDSVRNNFLGLFKPE